MRQVHSRGARMNSYRAVVLMVQGRNKGTAVVETVMSIWGSVRCG